MGNEVVHDLSGTSQFAPGVLVTTHSMQQVKDGIAFAARLISGRRIDGQTAVQVQHIAVIPYLRYTAMRHLVHFIQISTVAANDKNIGHTRHITNLIDVARVGYLQAVSQECIAVKFRLQRFGRGKFPYTVFVFCQIGYTGAIELTKRSLDFLCRQEISRHLYFHCFRCLQAESHRIVVVNFGRYHRGASPKGLLCKSHCTYQQHG